MSCLHNITNDVWRRWWQVFSRGMCQCLEAFMTCIFPWDGLMFGGVDDSYSPMGCANFWKHSWRIFFRGMGWCLEALMTGTYPWDGPMFGGVHHRWIFQFILIVNNELTETLLQGRLQQRKWEVKSDCLRIPVAVLHCLMSLYSQGWDVMLLKFTMISQHPHQYQQHSTPPQ